MSIRPISYKNKPLTLYKTVLDAQFDVQTVLTLDPFNYVELWLRRNGYHEAMFYWKQARQFRRAASELSIEATPLVLYYCFMNAAKALLSSKGITFHPVHGVGAHHMRGPNSKVVLSNEGISIRNHGIVPSLISYFQENESATHHSLEEVLYNLVFVHRTYCLSYKAKRERFLPLRKAIFVRDDTSGEVRLDAEPVHDSDWGYFRRHLPTDFRVSPDGAPSIQSEPFTVWSSNSEPTRPELDSLADLNRQIRKSIHYINGAQTLWYLKSSGNYEINRHPTTLTLSAMHRLSEICRYRPSELQSLLNGQKNWLLSEFVSMSPSQFLDEIACEITGHQIMIPNIRTPN